MILNIRRGFGRSDSPPYLCIVRRADGSAGVPPEGLLRTGSALCVGGTGGRCSRCSASVSRPPSPLFRPRRPMLSFFPTNAMYYWIFLFRRERDGFQSRPPRAVARAPFYFSDRAQAISHCCALNETAKDSECWQVVGLPTSF